MLEYLYAALNSRFGIKLQTSNVGLLRQRLYAIRKESGDKSLDILSFSPSPTDPSTLWIVKREHPQRKE